MNLPSRKCLRRRLGSAVAAVGLIATGAAMPAQAEAAEAADGGLLDITGTLQRFDPVDFLAQALELPESLHAAVERDLGVSAERFLADAATARSATQVVDGLQAAGVDIAGAVFDRNRQELGVAPASADQASVAAIEAAGATVLDHPPVPPEPTVPIVPMREFKGGYGYGVPNAGGELKTYCSAGFNGFGADGGQVILTAGHCFPEATRDTPWVHVDTPEPWSVDTAGWPGPGAPLGRGIGGPWIFGDDHDTGLLRLDEPGWTPVPAVTTWSGGNGDPSSGQIPVTDQAAPMVGQPICRSGVTTGYQCGEVIAVNHTVQYGADYGGSEVTGFLTSACSAPGDSGGPFVSGTMAVGVLSGAGGPESGRCADWDPEVHVSFGYALSGSSASAETFYADGEWELAVAVATPQIDDVDVTGTGPALVGRVPHAGPDHLVAVRAAGERYTAPVGRGGRFSVRLDDLPDGQERVRFTAWASYGEHSQSDTVNGTLKLNMPAETGGSGATGMNADVEVDADDGADGSDEAPGGVEGVEDAPAPGDESRAAAEDADEREAESGTDAGSDGGTEDEDDSAEGAEDPEGAEGPEGADGAEGAEGAEDKEDRDGAGETGGDADAGEGQAVAGGDGEALPDTGVGSIPAAIVGVALLAAGAALWPATAAGARERGDAGA